MTQLHNKIKTLFFNLNKNLNVTLLTSTITTKIICVVIIIFCHTADLEQLPTQLFQSILVFFLEI